jgi:hypothetical protein
MRRAELRAPRLSPRVTDVVAGVLAVALAAACVAPARSIGAYRGKGEASAATSRSAVETGKLTATLVRRNGLFPPQVSVLLAEAEQTAESAASTFASIQPPDPALDAYRSRLLATLGEATDALSALRISARRGDLEALSTLARPLAEIAAELERFAGSQA